MERKALGKGLNALIPDSGSSDLEGKERVVYLRVDQIKPNPFQPREDFQPEAMQDLVQSIREKGLIQPILVRQQGENYELIAGERRFRAANTLGIKEIPAIVKKADDMDSLELSLIENIQRQNLNPIEEAKAYQFLIDKFQLTQERVSDLLGKARATITNMLRLLRLPAEIQKEIKDGRISYGHGRALLELQDVNQQRMLAQEIISKSLSVRDLENIIKSQRTRMVRSRPLPGVRDPYVAVVEEELQHALATKVRVDKKQKRGTIVIDFYSQEDLERIVRKIRGEG